LILERDGINAPVCLKEQAASQVLHPPQEAIEKIIEIPCRSFTTRIIDSPSLKTLQKWKKTVNRVDLTFLVLSGIEENQEMGGWGERKSFHCSPL
jgi:hypothetical protein